MNVRKFVAGTARDALSKVKELLGPEAIILSSRMIPEGVEIMAVASADVGDPPSVPSAAPKPKPVKAKPKPDDELFDDYTLKLSASASALKKAPIPNAALVNMALKNASAQKKAASPREPNAIKTPPLVKEARAVKEPALNNERFAARESPARERPAVREAPATRAGAEKSPKPFPPPAKFAPEPSAEITPVAVLSEVRSLRKIVERYFSEMTWSDAARKDPVKTEITRHLLEVGFSPRFTRDMLVGLPTDIDLAGAHAWVRERADRMLDTLDADTDIVNSGGVYALVGPTGVGKTTTTAKLAARSVMRHGANKVTLVTTDVYRIGAYEQLKIYGRILGVSVYLAKDAKELDHILNDLRNKHIVLIDTIGMSQKDKQVEEQVAMFGKDVRRLLLLSATSRGETLDDVVRAYTGSGLTGCILNKIDEATGLASALDVILRSGLCLYYVSNGQRVPEDLHLPDRALLMREAFKEIADLSPQQMEGIEPGLMMAGAGLFLGEQHA